MLLHLCVILFTRGVSVSEGLCPGGLCKGGYLSEGLCLGGLCPGGGLCSRGFSVQGGSLYSVRETLLYGNVWVVCIQLECILVTIRKQSCRKVMFLHLSVSHSVHGGGYLPQCILGYTPLPSACWDTQCPVHAGIDMSSAGTHPTGMHSYYL